MQEATELSPSSSVGNVNKAYQHFICNEDGKDQLLYDACYSEKSIAYLLHSSIRTVVSSCHPYVFINQATPRCSFGEQLEQLLILHSGIQRDICFIATAPSSVEVLHYICGILTADALLVVDPGSLFKHYDYVEHLRKLYERYKLTVYVSAASLQKGDSFVSCGPICVELAISLLSYLKEGWSNSLKKLAKSSKGKEQDDAWLNQIDISPLLPTTLRGISQLLEKDYQQKIIQIRATHCNRLMTMSKVIPPELSDATFWDQCENADIQIVMNQLCFEKKTLLEVQSTSAYRRLIEKIHANKSISLGKTSDTDDVIDFHEKKDIYIPPHRRRQVNTINSVKTRPKNIPSYPAVQLREKPHQDYTSRFFTSHASLRQEQRNISATNINKAFYSGEKLSSKESVTYIDEDTQVVLGRNGKVITVQDNKRNTSFNLLNISKEREEILLREIERKNNDYAMCELAEIYLSGALGNREVQKAHTLLLRAAKKRNSHAMCLLSQLYEDGDLGTIDLEEANMWLERAAERDNRYALAILGQRLLEKCLQLDEGEEFNKKADRKEILLQKAVHYLKRSAAKGSTRAMWQIAKIYEEGWAGEQDLAKAIAIYTEAANLGSPASLRELQRLVNEEEVSSEAFEAILEKASNLIAKTSSDLAVDIGVDQILGKLGTNQQRGFRLLEQAAKRNNENAMHMLADCYRDGIGCMPDPVLSQLWINQLKSLYKKAIELGNTNALVELGDLLLNNAFQKINIEEAEKIFVTIAKRGNTEDIYYLGKLYIEGRLGDRDPAEGIPLINKAIAMWSEQALKDNSDSAKNLIALYLNKQLGFKNYQKAAQWLSFLASKGSSLALVELSSLYLKRKINLKADKENKIFSHDLLILLRKKAIDTEHHKLLWVLAELYVEGYLPKEEKTEGMNPWAQQLETILCKNGQNIAAAGLLLGRFYQQEGGLLPKNLQQAAKWLCLASGIDVSRASFLANHELEVMLSHEKWDESERKQILTGVLEYANQANKKEPYRIGRIVGDIYYKGKLIGLDYNEACNWYEIAAKLNNSKAMYRLGKIFQSGLLGTTDLDKAKSWLELAANRGNQKAIKEIAKLGGASEAESETSIRSSVTPEKQYNNEGILSKDPDSMFMLGKQYKLGSEGKTKDPLQAAFWFRRAVKKEHTEAAFELGHLYDSGQLGKNVCPVAVNFFKLAAKKNHLGAIQALIDIYSKRAVTEVNSRQLIKWQMKERNINSNAIVKK